MEKITGATTKLERNVQKWANEQEDPEGSLKDLLEHGCQSGMVGHLIYCGDTMKFFLRHKAEINALLTEAIANCGKSPADVFGDKWDAADPLAIDTENQNLLAWFGFEEAALNLTERNGLND